MKGKVFLVGAGVLGVDNLTLKAYKVISEADVILYDRLVDKGVLKIAKRGAKLIYVGKGPGDDPVKQQEIIALMKSLVSEGLCVVRLKSGDPFIFGRGGEELQVLEAEGIEVEVVPGLTSAVALPTLAKIPLTMRGLSSSVIILSGSLAKGEDEKEYLMAHAKFPGTLVLLMSMKKLSFVAESLIEGGIDPETPVAIITSADLNVQREVLRIKDLSKAPVSERGPGVLVIGKVVGAFAR